MCKTYGWKQIVNSEFYHGETVKCPELILTGVINNVYGEITEWKMNHLQSKLKSYTHRRMYSRRHNAVKIYSAQYEASVPEEVKVWSDSRNIAMKAPIGKLQKWRRTGEKDIASIFITTNAVAASLIFFTECERNGKWWRRRLRNWCGNVICHLYLRN